MSNDAHIASLEAEKAQLEKEVAAISHTIFLKRERIDGIQAQLSLLKPQKSNEELLRGY